MSTYLLIHGAWHGGWCWRKVAPLLEAKGCTVRTPDLPGHGDDKTPTTSVTMQRYVNRICEEAEAQPEPVILLGHSMGGAVITQAGENCSRRIRALVYLCAFLPRNGETVLTWARKDRESLVKPNVIPLGEGVVGLKPEGVREAFYTQCSDEDAEFGRLHLVSQSSQPFNVPVRTSDGRWGAIPRYYIECSHDRAVTHALQREMQNFSPCRRTFTIDADHSPFFSAPQELADILIQIANLS